MTTPVPRTQPNPSFVGRQTELAGIAARLGDPACRLLTLVGPGGIGKSRLAQATVERHQHAYPDGAVFIPLQALDSPALIVQAVAEGLCCYLGQTGDPRQELLDKLVDQQALLALDNFEHLLDGADLVADILAAAPGDHAAGHVAGAAQPGRGVGLAGGGPGTSPHSRWQ